VVRKRKRPLLPRLLKNSLPTWHSFTICVPGGKIRLRKAILKSYVFKVVVEPDEFEDGTPAFHAYCPNLRGARTYGKTQEEALRNIHDVVKMIVDALIEQGKPVPPDIEIESPAVIITV
jgi:predicted RNase H-like HicB family nuclease